MDDFFATIVDQYTPVASFGTIDKGTPRAIYVVRMAPDADDPDTLCLLSRRDRPAARARTETTRHGGSRRRDFSGRSSTRPPACGILHSRCQTAGDSPH